MGDLLQFNYAIWISNSTPAENTIHLRLGETHLGNSATPHAPRTEVGRLWVSASPVLKAERAGAGPRTRNREAGPEPEGLPQRPE